jgi:hypothetical protein
MTGHLDADGLAEFRAGLTAGHPRQRIAAHLSSCPQCTELDERLAAVSSLLAAVPLPPVPDALARRLDSVLAAEKPLTSERAVVPADGPRRRFLGLSSALSGRFSSRGSSGSSSGGSSGGWSSRGLTWRVLTPVTAVAVLAAAGFGLSHLGSSTLSSSSASSGTASGPTAGNAPRSMQMNSDHPAIAGPVAGAAESGGRLSVVDSGVDYEPATLARQLSSALALSAPGTSMHKGVPAPPAVAACVSKVSDGQKPVLVQRAKYQGAPVTVVIVRTRTLGYQALLAGSMCSATDSDIVAEAVLSPGISAP